MLNFENILRQYFPDVTNRHQKITRLAGKLLGLLFQQHQFEQFANENPKVTGLSLTKAILDFFSFEVTTSKRELHRIPKTGRVIIVANHPIGSLDGIGLLDLVGRQRSDVKVVANDMLWQLEGLRPLLLPVNNMGGHTARQHLLDLHRHLASDGALIIFPAGEVSRLTLNGISDGPWHPGFVKLAQTTVTPVLPVHITGRNSRFFYALSILIKPLSTAWLVREMFKQRGASIGFTVGEMIHVKTRAEASISPTEIAAMIKTKTYELGSQSGTRKRTPEPQHPIDIAEPEPKQSLVEDIARCEVLSETPDGKQILLTESSKAPSLLREIGRLRELTFRQVGEGSGHDRDLDQFDDYYHQLIVWDPERLEVAGAYRLGNARDILKLRGIKGLYTSTLFNFDEGMKLYFDQGLELGRSFVQPCYQNRQALDYLWLGIGAYLQRKPHIRFLFGSASISAAYGPEATSRIAHFFTSNYDQISLGVTAKTPFNIDPASIAPDEDADDGIDADERLRRLTCSLRDYLASRGHTIPTLYKHYAQATEHRGVAFTALNVDPIFSNCVDCFVLADLTLLKSKKKRRYLGNDWQPIGEKGYCGSQHETLDSKLLRAEITEAV